MKKVFLVFVFSFISFLVSVPIYGQSYQTFRSELEQITKRARWRIGPFRIYPTIQFRNIGYDDNVYYKREEDNPISDYTATISPEAKVYLLFRNWLILSFSENPEYVYYVKEKRERAFNNSYSPELKLLLFHRFVISGDYQFRKARRRASSEFDVRAVEEVKGYNGRFFYETARGTSFGFSGVIRKISYEDITLPGQEIYLSRLLNREEREGNLEFYYRIFSGSFFFIKGGYTEYNFVHPQSPLRDSYSYQANFGIRFPLLRRVRGTLSLGYKKLMPRKEGEKGFSGFVGDTTLDFRLRRLGFRLQYNRDLRFSFMRDNIFFIEDRYGAGISFYLTRFLRVDYNFTYGEANYPKEIAIWMPDGGYEEIKRKDIYRIQTVGFVFRIIRNTGIGLMVNFWERDSNYFGAIRDRMFIGGYVTYEF